MNKTQIRYKIVVETQTGNFNYVVREITAMPGAGIKKRDISAKELATWKKDEFIAKMEESGYGNCSKYILERVTFRNE